MFFDATAVSDVLLVDVDHEVKVDEDVVVLQDVHVPALAFVVQDGSADSADEALLLDVFLKLHSLHPRIDDRIDDGGAQNVHENQLHERIKDQLVDVDMPVIRIVLVKEVYQSIGVRCIRLFHREV